MKNIKDLTNYEIYKHIFNRIFGYKVDYPESWNIEKILNEEENPNPFIAELYPEIVEKIDELKKKYHVGGYSYKSEYYEEKYKLLEDNFLYESIQNPVFLIDFSDNYITIYLDYIKNERVKFIKVEEFKSYENKHYIRFYDNGDISISGYISNEYRTSFFDKSTSSYSQKYERFLSFNETLKMREYFKKQKIKIEKELDYVI